MQVWDRDPESNEIKLLIDADPLFLANDPSLHRLLRNLARGETAGVDGYSTIMNILEWAGFLLLKALELIVEILL